jgi:hypothetical protein
MNISVGVCNALRHINMQLLKMPFIHHVSLLIRRIFPPEQCSMNSPCFLMPEGGALLIPQKLFDNYRLSLIIVVIYRQEEQYLFFYLFIVLM